jgi:hypothetical protein
MLTDVMIQKLSHLHSFVRPRDSKIFAQWLVPKEDYVRGVYFNDAEHFIIISDTGLHLVNRDTVLFIPYDVISSVALPQDERSSALILQLRDGKESIVEVLNSTQEYPDLHTIYDVLKSVIFYPHHSRNTDDIVNIKSPGNLKDFLDDQDWEMYADIVGALLCGFPKRWQLEAFKIDPRLLEREDVWRLLALFLSRDPPVIHDEVRLSASQRGAAENFEVVGEIAPSPTTLAPVPAGLSSEINKSLSKGSAEILTSAEQLTIRSGGSIVSLPILLASLLGYDSELTCGILGRGLNSASLQEFLGVGIDRDPQQRTVEFSMEVALVLQDAFVIKTARKDKKILPEHIVIAMSNVDSESFVELLNSFERH